MLCHRKAGAKMRVKVGRKRSRGVLIWGEVKEFLYGCSKGLSNEMRSGGPTCGYYR